MFFIWTSCFIPHLKGNSTPFFYWISSYLACSFHLNMVCFQFIPCQYLNNQRLFSWFRMDFFFVHMVFSFPWYLTEQHMPGLSQSENTEVDPEKLHARLEVLSIFFIVNLFILYLMLFELLFLLTNNIVLYNTESILLNYLGIDWSALQYIVTWTSDFDL